MLRSASFLLVCSLKPREGLDTILNFLLIRSSAVIIIPVTKDSRQDIRAVKPEDIFLTKTDKIVIVFYQNKMT
jgi:hypothetical protein